MREEITNRKIKIGAGFEEEIDIKRTALHKIGVISDHLIEKM